MHIGDRVHIGDLAKLVKWPYFPSPTSGHISDIYCIASFFPLRNMILRNNWEEDCTGKKKGVWQKREAESSDWIKEINAPNDVQCIHEFEFKSFFCNILLRWVNRIENRKWNREGAMVCPTWCSSLHPQFHILCSILITHPVYFSATATFQKRSLLLHRLFLIHLRSS